MAKTIKFNTRRPYTADGQIIIATLHDDGVATFHDISRMITGEFAYGTAYLDHFDSREFEREVMHRYDHYEAPQTSRSWNDGMMSGACNTHGGFVAYQLAQAAPAPLMAQPVQQAQAKAPGAAPKPFKGTIAIDANWQNLPTLPTRTPNMTGQGEHDFTAHATAYDHGNGRSYRVALYQLGQGPGATIESTVYLDGRELPESHRADIRAAAHAAYAAAFLGLTPALVADYKAARAAQAERIRESRLPFSDTYTARMAAGYAGLALGRVYQAHRKGERIKAPVVSSWGAWGTDSRGNPSGERWLEWATSSRAIRFVGYADEIAGRGIDHKGWFLDDDGAQGETYRGAVWQLPSRGGRPVYVPGYVENISGQEGGRLDFSNLQFGDVGGEGDSAKRDAAHAGDSLAERDAERARDYNRAYMAGSLYAQALEEAQAAKVELRQLLKDRRDMRAQAQGAGEAAMRICRVITAKARELAFDRAALVKKAAKLIAGDYAERNLFAYWSSNDAAELQAFCEGADLTPDEYKARA